MIAAEVGIAIGNAAMGSYIILAGEEIPGRRDIPTNPKHIAYKVWNRKKD